MHSDEPRSQRDSPLDPSHQEKGDACGTSPFLSSRDVSLDVGKTFILDHRDQQRRLWTSLAVCLVSLAAFLTASFLMAMVGVLVVHGKLDMEVLRNPDTILDVARSRLGFVMLVILPQFILVAPAVIAAFMSPTPMLKRLSLVRGHWPIWSWLAAAAATPLIGLISSLILGAFVSESESLKQMSQIFRDHGTNGFLIPLALLIGVTPAICEELLFRGYLQTRFTGTLHPAIGILMASGLFAIFHFDPVHVLAVFPNGALSWLAQLAKWITWARDARSLRQQFHKYYLVVRCLGR